MESTGRRATVPKIFQGIPDFKQFKAPGPIKKALKDINYIKELNTIPCAEASPLVYITTAYETAPPALLSLVLPGCTDIAKTKLGLSPWHLRGVKGMISKITAPEALAAKTFLYKIGYFTAEKYLWFFQVADVTKNFFITWQSQVFMAQQCQLPGAGTADGYITAFTYPPTPGQHMAISARKLVPGMACGLNKLVIFPGFQGSVGWSVTWDSWPIPGMGGDVSTWVVETGTEDVQQYSRTSNQPGSNGMTTGGHWYGQNQSLLAPREWEFFLSNNSATPMTAVGGTWTMSLQGRQSGLTNYGCHLPKVSWPFP